MILPAHSESLEAVLKQGLWSERVYTSATSTGKVLDEGWSAALQQPDGSVFNVLLDNELAATVNWAHSGQHNVANALSAMAAARHVGVSPDIAAQALSRFQGVKRRMELLAEVNGVAVYDDFAHHPTAIATTLAGLRAKVGQQKITAIIEPRSNTMRMGAHLAKLANATQQADRVIWYQPPGLDWSLESVVAASQGRASVNQNIDHIITEVVNSVQPGEQIVIMSNGGFAGIHQKLVSALQQ